jgi:GNAT superfamily N-acetyltransferase
MSTIRPCRAEDEARLLAIVNSAAVAYRGVIPCDCWREPYMSSSELRDELAAGVEFSGYEIARELVGVMGIQPVGDVSLIRHAYVLREYQGHGVGTALIQHLLRGTEGRRVLVGTWAAAEWAIRFYRRHGFSLVSAADLKTRLLKSYWTVPDRQIEVSVVLANPPLG